MYVDKTNIKCFDKDTIVIELCYPHYKVDILTLCNICKSLIWLRLKTISTCLVYMYVSIMAGLKI